MEKIAFLRKTFGFIAKGLIEKEQLQTKEAARYPYSRMLQHGINMFCAASQQAGFPVPVEYADEASFLSHFVTQPIAEWFSGWDQKTIQDWKLEEEMFYFCRAFACKRNKNGVKYTPSEDCYEFLNTQDKDILKGTDQRVFYERMIELDQEMYCKIRKYVIEHLTITIGELREMRYDLAGNTKAMEAFQFAYEEDDAEGAYRLKKGIEYYVAQPGKLELDVEKYCKKKKLSYQLWPQMDRYDIEIQFPDGEIWEIDAKAWRNPKALRKRIREEHGFPEGDYAMGYFVVPDEYTKKDRDNIEQELKHQKNVKCVNLNLLKRAITKKEAACGEKNR